MPKTKQPPIQLDRDQPIAMLVSDLATILGPSWMEDEGAQAYRVDILVVLAEMHRAVEAEIAMYAHGAIREGATWQQVGDALGISRQAAHKRFSR